MNIDKIKKKFEEYENIEQQLYLEFCNIYIRLLEKYKYNIIKIH